MFEWNGNIAEIWDQFLNVIEVKQDRDTSMFNQGPWRTFGVTRDEVQIAIKQGTDSKTIVDGILYCADGQNPNLQEHRRCIAFEPAAVPPARRARARSIADGSPACQSTPCGHA